MPLCNGKSKYSKRTKVFEQQKFAFIYLSFYQHNNFCRYINMGVDIKRYVN